MTTVYIAALSLLGLVLTAGSFYTSRRSPADDKFDLLKRNARMYNQFQLLWIASMDLCAVAQRLSAGVKQAQSHHEDLEKKIIEINSQIATINRRLGAKADALGESVEAVAPIAIKAASATEVDGLEESVFLSDRVVDDIQTLTAIWNKTVTIEKQRFSVNEMVQRDIEALKTLALTNRRDFLLDYRASSKIMCASDPTHLSRCFRAILAQAIRQSSGRSVLIETEVFEPILSSRSQLEIRVTDSSKVEGGGKRDYPMLPSNYKNNALLRDSASSMLRMNIASSTIRAMGGELKFKFHDRGNMTFIFRAPVDTV